jgi:ribonuclease P protein component
LSKNERLKSYKRIRLLFAKGQKMRVQSLLIYFQLQPHLSDAPELAHLQMGVTVSARYFKKAVDRNLIKRRIREAYRKNNSGIKSVLTQHKMSMDVFFVYTHAEVLLYNQLESSMQKALQLLTDKIYHISISKA